MNKLVKCTSTKTLDQYGDTVTCKVIDFGKGLKNARKYGTEYNPLTKTWEISNYWPGLNDPKLNGLQIVDCAQAKRAVAQDDPTSPYFNLTRAMERENSIY